MPVRFGGVVMYLCAAITNLLTAKATAIAPGKIRQECVLPPAFPRLPPCWRQQRLLLFPFELQDLRRRDVCRRNNRKSAQQQKLRRRFREHQDESCDRESTLANVHGAR